MRIRAEFEASERLHSSIALTREVLASTRQRVDGLIPMPWNPHASPYNRLSLAFCLTSSVGKLLEPFIDQTEAAVRDDVLAILRDEAGGLALQAGPQVVMDGLGPLLCSLEVRRGVNVETDDLRLGALGRQPPLEELAEQVVVPVALFIKAIREQATVLEICQVAAAVVDAGKALGHLWGDLLENRGRQEEIARLLGLLVEHLLSQEVEESAIGGGGDRTG